VPRVVRESSRYLRATNTAELAGTAETLRALCVLCGFPPPLGAFLPELRRGSPKRLRRAGGCGVRVFSQ
jgi:hypothetical protein